MKMPSSVMSDHMSRLYLDEKHIDKEGAVITVVRVLKSSIEIDITDEAIADFLSDMDYQIEFSEGSYKSACQYGYKKMKHNLS
jgi:hypothetical protein